MITFTNDAIAMPSIDTASVSKWIKQIAAFYHFSLGTVHYIFCSDQRILEVNRQFLGHDYYTDIITFDYCTPTTLNGDIYISLDTVKTNAELYVRTDNHDNCYEQELLRVIIHGILHLTGQDDKAPGKREEMEEKENHALTVWAERYKS